MGKQEQTTLIFSELKAVSLQSARWHPDTAQWIKEAYLPDFKCLKSIEDKQIFKASGVVGSNVTYKSERQQTFIETLGIQKSNEQSLQKSEGKLLSLVILYANKFLRMRIQTFQYTYVPRFISILLFLRKLEQLPEYELHKNKEVNQDIRRQRIEEIADLFDNETKGISRKKLKGSFTVAGMSQTQETNHLVLDQEDRGFKEAIITTRKK